MWLVKFMLKSVIAILVVVSALSVYGIYSAKALPEWFDPAQANGDYANGAISQQIEKGGVNLLAQKSLDILSGEVAFNEAEFNALFLASLKADPDGRRLLNVSDGVRAFLRNGEVELSAVINLNKLEQSEPKAREAVEKFDRIFWIVEEGRVAVTVFGTPEVRQGGIGVKDTFRAKVGEIAFSNETLRSLKVPVERANETQLAIDFLRLRSVNVKPNKIEFGVQSLY